MAAPFDGLIAASASAESSSEQLPYDVFINHHGGDVKDGLATTIHNKIDATGLRVFLDKYELKFGNFFPEALEQAMRTSRIHIAIFSKNYAQSPWCLAELQYILQLPQIKFIPIFYHVEPFVLRWAIDGKGIYADAFSQYEVKGRYSPKLLQSWKSALHQASLIKGEIINNQRKHELDACEKTCEGQLMAVQNDAAAASFNRPDTSVVQSLVPRNKRSLSPASGPNKRRKMIKVLGKDGGPRRSLRINKPDQTKEAKDIKHHGVH